MDEWACRTPIKSHAERQHRFVGECHISDVKAVGKDDRQRPAPGLPFADDPGFEKHYGRVELPRLDCRLLHGIRSFTERFKAPLHQAEKPGNLAGQEIPAPQKNTTRPSPCACNRRSEMSGRSCQTASLVVLCEQSLQHLVESEHLWFGGFVHGEYQVSSRANTSQSAHTLPADHNP